MLGVEVLALAEAGRIGELHDALAAPGLEEAAVHAPAVAPIGADDLDVPVTADVEDVREQDLGVRLLAGVTLPEERPEDVRCDVGTEREHGP